MFSKSRLSLFLLVSMVASFSSTSMADTKFSNLSIAQIAGFEPKFIEAKKLIDGFHYSEGQHALDALIEEGDLVSAIYRLGYSTGGPFAEHTGINISETCEQFEISSAIYQSIWSSKSEILTAISVCQLKNAMTPNTNGLGENDALQYSQSIAESYLAFDTFSRDGLYWFVMAKLDHSIYDSTPFADTLETFENSSPYDGMLTPIKYLKKSAELGFCPAMIDLADKYESGMRYGVPQSPIDAYIWYVNGILFGCDHSEEKLERMAAALGDKLSDAAHTASNLQMTILQQTNLK